MMCFALIFFYEALFMHATIKLCPKILQNFSQSSQEKPVLAKPFDLFKAVSRPHIFYFFVGMWLWMWKYVYIMTTFFFLKKKAKYCMDLRRLVQLMTARPNSSAKPSCCLVSISCSKPNSF